MSWIYEIGTLKYFTQDKMENNATEFYNYFSPLGYTLEAICGMLGNIQRESTLNPGLKERESTSSGWGLIQWTPSTNLTDYATAKSQNWYAGDLQCLLINDEILNGYGGQWIPTKTYPYSGAEFSQLKDVEEAVKSYCYERERAGVVALDERIQNGKNWYEYLSGKPPTPIPTTSKKMPIYMMIRNRIF